MNPVWKLRLKAVSMRSLRRQHGGSTRATLSTRHDGREEGPFGFGKRLEATEPYSYLRESKGVPSVLIWVIEIKALRVYSKPHRPPGGHSPQHT